MSEIVLIGFYLFIMLYSVILHEISHGVVAMWLGDMTAKYAGRINLNPVNHVDPIGSIVVPLVMMFTMNFAFGWARPVPYNPYNLRNQKWGPLLVGLAGPATNLAIAFLAVLIAKIIPIPWELKKDIIENVVSRDWEGISTVVAGSMGSITFVLTSMIIVWNVLLGFFNLIPVPPLDGSKILYSFLPLSVQTQAMLEQFGFIILLFVLVLFSTPISLFLSSMIAFFFSLTL